MQQGKSGEHGKGRDGPLEWGPGSSSSAQGLPRLRSDCGLLVLTEQAAQVLPMAKPWFAMSCSGVVVVVSQDRSCRLAGRSKAYLRLEFTGLGCKLSLEKGIRFSGERKGPIFGAFHHQLGGQLDTLYGWCKEHHRAYSQGYHED